MSRRSIRTCLHAIDANITVILDITKGRTHKHFQHDIALRYATLHALMMIADATAKLPEPILAPYPDIPWLHIIGLGAMLKQGDHQADSDVVWSTVTIHLPALRPVIKTLIADHDQPGLPL